MLLDNFICSKTTGRTSSSWLPSAVFHGRLYKPGENGAARERCETASFRSRFGIVPPVANSDEGSSLRVGGRLMSPKA
ncbi:hypothetical protein PF005_g13936 [Phytophthora fragariae]|uniref:Uncharacterized protein n=1 Tax=Phytophthora fragariae TaxID=53985 RepID=A0A6A3EP24_9STRA|nr:hypothetical protein PF009_g18130 [Phytophthora fragariae]KAE8996602.1 hypothetical protein PF011_g15842 [Phytophthora fragariae]KAE9096182.1 hypothetical protein PF010_g16444 [Phytophthora fragariae]KAE9104886.1 hypothetical protein PF007_g13901 [Phytophthora fragariae]KAE9141640.1 hypothetical protein PF006_g13135 [Phytophthora fragariae]